MSFSRSFMASFLAAVLALAPVVADARAGASSSSSGSSYSSMGSRGSRTYAPVPGAQTVQRSLTPPGGPSGVNGPAAPFAPGAGAGPYGYGQPSFAQRHPFMTGVLGGIAGSWLGSMFFGGSSYAYGGGLGHAGGAFGSFIMLLVLFGIGWAAFRAFRFATTDFALMGRPGAYGAGGFATASGGRAPQTSLVLTDSDFNAFADALNQVQQAWGNGDLAHLQRYATPEMLSYFSEQLANNQSQGLQNRVHHVVLLRGEPREAWAEGITEYATVYLRWSAVDYTVRLDRRPTDPDFVVEGDPQRPVEAQEVWSFRRSQGGRWLLSAIQQV
ncbi:MAG TPA: TIM44-like domain-containing protein [Aliidongia sp.]|nr:TIM44-like domain-containing protein [Aliidongia sp.]